MKDGSYLYNIETDFPLGKQHGKLRLEIKNEHVSGSLRLLGQWHPFTDGSVRDGQFFFQGQLAALFFMADYEASGTVDEKKVALDIRLPSHTKHWTGVISTENSFV